MKKEQSEKYPLVYRFETNKKLIPRRSTLTFAVAGLDFGVFGDTPSWNLRLGVFWKPTFFEKRNH